MNDHKARPQDGTKRLERGRYAAVANCAVCGRKIIETTPHTGRLNYWKHTRKA